MEDPNIIATLIATKPLAERTSQLDHNCDRYEPPLSDDRPFSRESTPFPGEDQGDNADVGHRLKLSFDKPPKNVREGFVFGWDPGCDIQLVDRQNFRPEDRKKVQYISKKHFSITVDAQRRVILRDSSRVGTAVSYDGQAQDEIRSRFTWIIFPDFDSIEVKIPGADISFEIQLGKHDSCEAQYFANVDSAFPQRRRPEESGLTSPMHKLNVRSQNTSAALSEAVTPRQGPIYLLHESLGHGAFGRVYKVVDVSTGHSYAGKSFYTPDWNREVNIMKKQHIVQFVDFREKPAPLLIMEYMPLGNLADEHRASPIAFEETSAILVQALQAVVHLHSQGLVHRDIKPDNILVFCRSPFIIKLADLGLAKDSRNGESVFKSWVGSFLYAAPEVWKGSPYTPAVDIWSLGVVVLEFAYGLPKLKSGKFKPQDWQRRITRAARDWDSDDLIDFLSASMLQLKPERRRPASECLETALIIDRAHQTKLELRNYQAGSATPTEKCSALTTLARVSEHEEQVLDCEENRFPTNLSTIRLDRGSAEKPSRATQRAVAQKDSSKRQRSPDSFFREDCRSRKTAIREPGVNRRAKLSSRSYAISERSVRVSGQHRTMHVNVLEFLKDMQIGDGSNESPAARTPGSIDTLCQQFKRLKIAEVKMHNDHVTEQTIVTAVSEAREFMLASLTSSDLANSVADLAQHLTHIMQLLSPDPQTSSESAKRNASSQCDPALASSRYVGNTVNQIDPAKVVSFQTPSAGRTTRRNGEALLPIGDRPTGPDHVIQSLASWPTNASDGLSTASSDYPYGLTFPAALLDEINVSGCAPPTTLQ